MIGRRLAFKAAPALILAIMIDLPRITRKTIQIVCCALYPLFTGPVRGCAPHHLVGSGAGSPCMCT